MEILQKVRVIIAAVLSPLIAPILIYVTLSILYSVEIQQGESIQASINAAIWVSYIVVVLAGALAYFLLRVKQWHSVRMHLLAGLCIGFVSWSLFSLFTMTAVMLLFFIYLIAGVLIAGGFWLIAYFQPNGNYPQRTIRRRKRRIG